MAVTAQTTKAPENIEIQNKIQSTLNMLNPRNHTKTNHELS
jgi:hypothetical protein